MPEEFSLFFSNLTQKDAAKMCVCVYVDVLIDKAQSHVTSRPTPFVRPPAPGSVPCLLTAEYSLLRQCERGDVEREDYKVSVKQTRNTV